jgi:hypothetical protein
VTSSSIQILSEGTNTATSVLPSIATHLAIGGGLFYGVQKFFEEIEKKLSVGTKDDIALWLLDLHPSGKFSDWRPTFAKLFDRVFGEKQLSWKCFWRSSLASVITSLIVVIAASLTGAFRFSIDLPIFLLFAGSAVLGNLIPDYFSLWKTRHLFRLGCRTTSIFLNILLFLADIAASIPFAIIAFIIGFSVEALLAHAVWSFILKAVRVQGPLGFYENQVVFLWFIPAFFGRLWLLAYFGSGMLLKTARRLDIGFAWFNKKFDVENHPLQCIGLVAGTLCALGYWLLAATHLVA